MTDDLVFGKREGLRAVLVAGGFVGEGLHEFVREYFDVCAFVVVEGVGGFLGGFLGAVGVGLGVEVGVVLLGNDDGGVGVAAEDALVPHEVVVDQLAG